MILEEVRRLLVEMGFHQDRAACVLEALIKRLSSRGMSAEQALEALDSDLRSGGKLSLQLKALLEKERDSTEAPPTGGLVCPKCGHPRPVGPPGSAPATECARCGVIFDKIAPAETAADVNPAGGFSTPMGGPTPATGRPSFISRHKKLVTWGGVLLFLFLLGLGVQEVFKWQFNKAVLAFDQELNMDTPEGLEASLTSLQRLIELTTLLVNKRGWSASRTTQFFHDTEERYRRFVQAMEQKADGRRDLFGYDTNKVRESLCGGMKMTLLSVRNKEFQSNERLMMALMPNGGYYACEVSEYSPSPEMAIVRDGKQHVLRSRREGDRPAGSLKVASRDTVKEKGGATVPASKDPGDSARSAMAAEHKAFMLARVEILRMQDDYRKEYNTLCEDVHTLLASHQSRGGKVSPSTVAMVERGVIVMKVMGKSVIVQHTGLGSIKR